MLPADLEGVWSFDRDKTRIEFESILNQQSIDLMEISLRSTRMMED
jgi:hypothetical protein